MINAIGILFIVVTVVCAVAWALLRQRERLQEAAA
jgi:cbb3-type cytochrome oxidase subunit 3